MNAVIAEGGHVPLGMTWGNSDSGSIQFLVTVRHGNGITSRHRSTVAQAAFNQRKADVKKKYLVAVLKMPTHSIALTSAYVAKAHSAKS